MAYVPLASVRSIAKSLLNGEGQSIIYRRSTITNNPTTGTPSQVDVDYTLVAFVGQRKSKFINGSLIRVPGERVLISALDLPVEPVAGDTVILGASESSSIRRKVATVKITGTQGTAIMYTVEVE